VPTVSDADIARWLGEFFYPFVRTLALFAFAPAFGANTVPTRLKVALALIVSLLIGSAIKEPAPLDISWTTMFLTVENIIIGAMMGFAMQLALTVMAIAGDLVGIQMGFGFATLLGVQTGIAVPVMSDFFALVGLILFLAFNGHLVLLGALIKSFDIAPVAPELAGNSLPASGWAALANSGAGLFEMGLFLALPVMAVVVTMQLVVGTLSRVAPQLNLMSVGFALFLWLGLAATIALVPYFVPAVEHIIDFGSGLIRAAVPGA